VPKHTNDRIRNGPAKRDRKAWCRGKVGVPHKYKTTTYAALKGYDPHKGIYQGWLVQYCIECGKELDKYYPPFFSRRDKLVPAWAEQFLVEHPEQRRK
jgi:hypothetical protein